MAIGALGRMWIRYWLPDCNETAQKMEKAEVIPDNAQARKAIPIATGVLDYFPDALCAVAECSRAGNEQHNPGKPLHWDRSKSTDEADALARHLMQRGTVDTDGIRHSAKVAWRALALLQKEIEDAQRPAPQFGDSREPGPIVPLTPTETNHPITDAKPPVLEEEVE